jgi:phosphate starvation-inducible PhoH-like protein
VLKGVEGIQFCGFTEVDVVRHPLVQEVVRAYETYEAEKAAEKLAEKVAKARPE